MDKVKLDGSVVYAKLDKIYDVWKAMDGSTIQTPEAFVVSLGKTVGDEYLRQHTEDFINWLLQYNFSDCVFIFTRQKIMFAGSPKKRAHIESMAKPKDYHGPPIELVTKELKMDDEANRNFIGELMPKYLGDTDLSKVSIFQKNEKVDGAMTQAVVDFLSKGGQQLEMRDFMGLMSRVKIEPEVQNLKMASKFVEWSVKNVIQEIENAIDNQTTLRHSQISAKIERQVDNEAAMKQFSAKYGGDSQMFAFDLPVLVQSAEASQPQNASFTLNKMNQNADKTDLNESLIFINVCGKYVDMNAMACRTILIDPTIRQKELYTLATQAKDHLVTNIGSGATFDALYKSTKQFILSKDSSLAERLHANFGFGIGLTYKEELMIAEGNMAKVKPGMTLHIRITFRDAQEQSSEGKRLTLAAVGDTVYVEGSDQSLSVVNLTAKIPWTYGQITYKLADDEDDVNKENKDLQQNRDTRETTKVLEGRTRGERARIDNTDRKENDKALKQSQAEKQEAKLKELQKRFERGEINTSSKKQRQKDLGKIKSYSSMKQIPTNLVKGQLYVDQKHETILVPINTEQFVAFHVSTINNLNVSKQSDGQWTYLRINFHTPSPGKSGSLLFPDFENDPDVVFLKELTLKNKDQRGEQNHLYLMDKKIKELVKLVKQKDAEEDEKQEEQALMPKIQVLKPIPGRRDMLENVTIKPNLEGKKSIGNLELYSNGVRYTSTKGLKLDIPFNQMKHAFFQPCAPDELLAIIHFTLKFPITLSNKKHQDVQFFKESGVAADDIDMRGARRRLNDLDELELEQRERQGKQKLSDRFYKFVQLVNNQSNTAGTPINFDMPMDDLFFTGCPAKSSVKIRPTHGKCLIAVSEFPSFVIDVNDIETVHFERVTFGIKNFDMAIIYKDFLTFRRINSIPRENIEELKEYLDSVGIIFSESISAFNWPAVLQKIRNDFESFLNDDGGWKFLQDDDEVEDAGADSELDDDPAFAEGSDVSEESDEESDFSEDEESEDASSGEDPEESEDALSWDEMEKRALDDDKKQAARRQEMNRARGKPGAKTGRRN